MQVVYAFLFLEEHQHCDCFCLQLACKSNVAALFLFLDVVYANALGHTADQWINCSNMSVVLVDLFNLLCGVEASKGLIVFGTRW